MTIKEALLRCPHLIIKTPDMEFYQKLSHQLHNFLLKKIPKVEQASIDEFYGDLEGWIEGDEIFTFINELKVEIKKELNLPVSIGASHTKSLAKLATTSAKPFGCKVVESYEVYDFVKDLKIEKFPGIGRQMQKKFKKYALFTLGDILASRELVESISPYAKELYKKIEGSDSEAVKTNRVRKSIGIARTFDAVLDRVELRRRVLIIVRHLSFAIMKLGVFPTTYHLSLSYSQNQNTHTNISSNEMFNEAHLKKIMLNLYKKSDTFSNLKVIRVSMSAGNFTHNSKRELSLIDFDKSYKAHKFSKLLFELRSKYGLNIIRYADEL